MARLAMGRTGPMRGPVRAHIVAELEPPVSWSAPRRAAALAQEIAPSVKPDLDNLLKNVYDAMNGIVYTDDSQIVSKIVDKRYGPRPRVIVRIEPTGQKPAYP
jgi:Holliday junction resolvase RusA-like endonuclease